MRELPNFSLKGGIIGLLELARENKSKWHFKVIKEKHLRECWFLGY
jgi:hypothetical protein